MGTRDRRNDREAEAAPFPLAALVAAREALERLREERIAEPWALVHHVQLGRPILGDGGHGDLAGAVAKGIVHEIGQGLSESGRRRPRGGP